MKLIEHVVSEAEEAMRIDKLLVTINPYQSRSKIQSLIAQQLVTVNGTTVKSNYKCERNDIIQWSFPDEIKRDIAPEDIPIEMVYEDDDVLVVNKPKGMVIHPNEQTDSGTLVNALLFHCRRLSNIAGSHRPGIVHRIDKDTSGLIVIAKSNAAHEQLAKDLVNKKIKRVYEAIIHGVLDHDAGTIEAPIARDPKNRLRMGVVENGRHAITHFQVVSRYKDHTHVECRLETGRTHQIRVHMNYIGHPLLGDSKYGSKKGDIKGQVLFAKKLAFNHPVKNEWMEFEVNKPTEFQEILHRLEKTT
ncbi:RluA family pseudouridine synthase [Virgibacillus sp. W0181]|uniref:RluA family pseudouridine synthase n=1 Tax=Virgibacillus sp. W0181 TaxID=3391581 RepID=UPI003F48CE91